MTSKLLIIASLGVGYYLFTKKQPIEKKKKYRTGYLLTNKTIPKKTLNISTVINQPIIQPTEIKSISIIIPEVTLEEAKEKRYTDILERSKIIAETSTDTAYAEMAARFVAQEAAKVAAAAKAIADAAAAKIVATAAALREKRYTDILTRSEIIAADTTQIIDYRSDAAKFMHQEKRRAEGWTKIEWQKEWRNMLNV